MGKFKVGDRVVWDRSAGGADIVEHWNMFWKKPEGDLTDDSFVVTRVTDHLTYYSNRAVGNGPCTSHKYLKLAPLKIEAGKFYKTRDGRKVGPMLVDSWHESQYGWTVDHYFESRMGKAWRSDGTFDSTKGRENIADLVAEWVDESKAQNDNRPTPKFKVGDIVIAKNKSSSGDVQVGDVLKVTGVYGDRISFVDRNGRNNGWTDRNFELFALPTAIVALIENGQPKPSALPYVHRTVDSANAEAKRLAGKHRGKKFGVYVLQSTEELAAPIYRHNWQTLAAKGEKIAAIKELRGITGLGLKATKDAVEHWLAYDEPVSRVAA